MWGKTGKVQGVWTFSRHCIFKFFTYCTALSYLSVIVKLGFWAQSQPCSILDWGFDYGLNKDEYSAEGGSLVITYCTQKPNILGLTLSQSRSGRCCMVTPSSKTVDKNVYTKSVLLFDLPLCRNFSSNLSSSLHLTPFPILKCRKKRNKKHHLQKDFFLIWETVTVTSSKKCSNLSQGQR